MLTRFVYGVPLTPERLAASPGAIDRAAAAFRALHDGAADFADTFRVFETLERYAALIDASGVMLTASQRTVLSEAQPVRAALSLRPAVLRPCHCDPTGRNLLDTGERVWLVDWEYAAMNDPMWDLAYFSVESDLDPAADQALLAAYLQRPPSAAEAARMSVTKLLCELLAATWALVQELQGNCVADFRAYAARAFDLAAARVAAPGFARAVETLRRG